LPLAEAASPSATGSPQLTGHPALLAVQLLLAVAYALATYGFFRRNRMTGDELSGWLSIACLFAAFARINYFLFPTLYSNWVYTGDVFRLVFYVVLLIGAAREIASYWAGTVRAAHLEERRRVARDLHDGLAQEIAFIGRNAQLLRDRNSTELVERVIAGAERAYLESRRLVGALASPGDEPLDRALREAAREVAARYGARLDLRVASGITLPFAGREALVRIASEAVANAARHSGESDIRVELERLDRHTRLRVVDRGCGFAEEMPHSLGFGLISMRERTEALGGQFSIRTGPGRGTVVEVLL
jgi:signal transduction histidine kinase